MKCRTSTTTHSPIQLRFYWLLAALLTATLYGCGDTVSPTSTGPATSFQRTSFEPDVIAFDNNVRTPIFRQYCKGCHEPGGSGTGAFADKSDVENAYNHANSRIDRTTIANSLIVQKVANNHNCWPTASDCAANAVSLTNAINAWVNADAEEISDGGTEEVQDIDVVSKLTPPVEFDPNAEAIVLDSTDPTQRDQFVSYIFTSDQSPTTGSPNIAKNCSKCHSENALQANQRKPYFATKDNPEKAFKEAINNRKIDINTPENSEMYKRLVNQHNCWSGSCQADAQSMLDAINAWKEELKPEPGSTPPVDGAESTVELFKYPISKALALNEGLILSGGKRYERNLIALWEFKEDDKTKVQVNDSSGVFPEIHLTRNENTDWVSGYGIEFMSGGSARASIADSQKLYDLISPRNEFSIEAWVVPANVTQEGPAIIASYSSGSNDRNFSMGQTLYSYEFLNRNTASGLDSSNTANGGPTLITDPDDEDLQATQQHVVMTYDPVNGRRIYVNGEFTGDEDSVLGGSLREWNDGYLFVLGAETNGTNGWLGKIRLAAIYNRALSQEQIQQNFDAGVGKKFNLLFKVGHITGISPAIPTNSYIWFQVSEYDDFSYLFSNPAFVVVADAENPDTTDTPPTFDNFNIQGMRIGVNGKEAAVGQVFANLNKNISLDISNPINPRYVNLIDTMSSALDGVVSDVPVSATGTIIPKQKGPSGDSPDKFYLTFDIIGGKEKVQTAEVEPDPLSYDYPDPTPSADLLSGNNSYISGTRTFEEINATMVAVTGVPSSTVVKDPDDENTDATTTLYVIFKRLEQQLPTGPALEAFLSAQQVGIAKLALNYCSALVEDSSKRDSFFGANTFEFDANVATAFSDDTKKDVIVNALYDNVVGSRATPLADQPSLSEVRTILVGDGTLPDTSLLKNLTTSCGSNCDAAATRTIVKSMCVSVLSSAAMLIQ